MKHGEGSFAGSENLPIYYQYWLPDGEPRAVIVISHGLAEHGGRYGNIIGRLVPPGFAVYALDHRGHGRSEGLKGYVRRFSDFTDDLASFIKIVKEKHPDKKMFVFGHSIGGTIAAVYAAGDRPEVDGLIFSAAVMVPGKSVSPALVRLGRVLSRLTPGLGLYALETSAISRDAAVVEAYRSDPLVYHGKTRVRLGMELINAMERLRPQLDRIKLPVLILHGTDDRLSEPAGSDMLYDRAGSADKTYQRYEGFYHEVFNEPGKEQVLADIESWLLDHV